ncbi:HAD family hydrolase [Actinokineospora bangkokensis]|uniref:Hydrolase n=1 Tax=Actinokineospora bangkokensis TaxID=1193682 RepID=A0A1Q9LJQ5_9PSEU|nr:HAD family hydrolase [Actinokineospora bangkokensis]OLR92233.1 hydrolase [Actinokineospora bangkokensis]
MSRTASAKVLIFDADDTLWENNVLFERVIEGFLDWLAHPTLDRAQVRAVLDEIEAANAVTHGYGAKMLLRSLHDCFAKLSERPADERERAAIDELAGALVRREVELIPGVEHTLAELGKRYTLLLLTKGDTEEQQSKLDASGLSDHFEHIHIVPEKNAETYAALVSEHGLEPEQTWMIGNSPKSDIRPARAVGMCAVFIPNDNTWGLEHDELDEGDDRVLTLRTFPELLDHF